MSLSPAFHIEKQGFLYLDLALHFKYRMSNQRNIVFCLFLLVALVYLPFINNPFVFDDIAVFRDISRWNFLDPQAYTSLRWLSSLSLKLTWDAFLDDIIAHRAINLLIHFCNCIMLIYLMREFELARGKTSKEVPLGAIAMSVAIFASSPVAVYATGYVLQRSVLLATFFSLAMQFSFIRALLTGESKWLWLTVLFYVCAIFSKEHAVLAPAILFALVIVFRQKAVTCKSNLFCTFVTCMLIASLTVFLSQGVLGKSYEHDAAMLIKSTSSNATDELSLWLTNLLTQSTLYFKYFALWCFPNPAWMSIDMREPFLSISSGWRIWIGFVSFITYGLGVGYLLFRGGKCSVIGFALLCPWLQFLVEFSTVRIQEPFVLYRSYLWIPSLFFILASVFASIKKTRVLASGFIILLTINVAAAWDRLHSFSDEYLLWDDAAKLLNHESKAGAGRIYYNRGNALLKDKKWNAAILDFQRVIAIHPEIAEVYYAIAIAYYNKSEHLSALEYFEKTVAIKPNYAQAFFGIAMTQNRLKHPKEAQEAMVKSCELDYLTACLISKKLISH